MPSVNKYLKVLLESKLETQSEFRLFMVYIGAIGLFGISVLTILLKLIYPILYFISLGPLWLCITCMAISFGTIIYIYENYYKNNTTQITPKDASDEDRDCT